MMFFSQSFKTLKRVELLYFTTFFTFLIRYRHTILGPIWVMVKPVAFVCFLGTLLVGLSNVGSSEFIPHLAVGYVAWTLFSGYLTRAPGIFSRNHAYIIDGNQSLTDAIVLDNLELIVHFLHQTIVIAAVCLMYKTATFKGVMISIGSLFIIIYNGYIFSTIVAFIGSRIRDIQEAVIPLSTILFIATPIIWMPGPTGGSGKGKILETYMNFNPFYHFLEIFRAPLLSNSISELTWIFVGATTVLGSLVALVLFKKLHSILPHWLR